MEQELKELQFKNKEDYKKKWIKSFTMTKEVLNMCKELKEQKNINLSKLVRVAIKNAHKVLIG